MASKRYQSRGLRTYWAVHIEAWRLSGLSCAAYCGEHQLKPAVIGNWLKKIGDADALQHKPLSKRKPPPRRSTSEVRNRAVQAFWAMQVEAQTWSGLSFANYASALRLPEKSLRRWREQLETGEVEINWRARLHPSALPLLSSAASTSANGSSAPSDLTEADMPKTDVCSNRRWFSDEEKLAIVLESERPGATISALAPADADAATVIAHVLQETAR